MFSSVKQSDFVKCMETSRSIKRKPTLFLAYQNINELKKPAVKTRKLKHNEKIKKVIKTDTMISLKNEYGKFTIKGNKAEFKDIRFVLDNHFFIRIITKKRIFKWQLIQIQKALKL